MTEFNTTVDWQDLRSILNSVTVLVDECRLIADDDVVRIRGTDPAGVGLVEIEIPETAFEDAELGDTNVCLDFAELTDMVSIATDADSVDLELDFPSLEINVLDLSFSLALIDPEKLKKDHQKPDFDLEGEIVINSTAFKRGVDAADLVADEVEFQIDTDDSAFCMRAIGDTNQVVMKRKKQDLFTLTMDEMKSKYSVPYLKDISKAIPEDSEVTLEFAEDFPAEISFDILDGDATVTYFISPRIGAD